MATRESKGVIYAAIFANIAIAVCKFAAAVVTGSSAMLAEAFHSTADSGNELLLLWGIKRSARPPDALHPYGYGRRCISILFWLPCTYSEWAAGWRCMRESRT
jgi:divalent metal cation (Fe/Co/Zn/Cd) transporter